MAIFAKLVLKSASLFRSRSGRKTLSTCSSSSSLSFGYKSDSDCDEGSDNLVPKDVPKGCMAIYVGSDEKSRFVVATRILKHPIFQVFLERAAEEYEYENVGALTIPCEAVLFEHFLWLLNNNDPAVAMVLR